MVQVASATPPGRRRALPTSPSRRATSGGGLPLGPQQRHIPEAAGHDLGLRQQEIAPLRVTLLFENPCLPGRAGGVAVVDIKHQAKLSQRSGNGSVASAFIPASHEKARRGGAGRAQLSDSA